MLRTKQITARGFTLALSTPQIMGILNVTPDSFSDGGKYTNLDSALEQARLMIKQGASIIDVGGESTRPGADLVETQEEIRRVLPVIEALHSEHPEVMLSVDTSNPQVMEECTKAGAQLWNDIRALQREGAIEMAAKLEVAVCLMHMQGDPKTMQINPHYTNVVKEVREFLLERAQLCEKAGIESSKIILDPGFGFGKSVAENYQLLKALPVLTKNTPYTLLSALSRKSMIGALTKQSVASERVVGSAIGAFYSFLNGADIVRVHDVEATVHARAMYLALEQAQVDL